MKYGFNLLLWTTFVEEEHADTLALLKRVGYDGVEIPAGDGPVDHYHTVRKLADDAGLACTAIAMATPEADPTSPDKAIRQAALERIKSRIDCAQILGSPILGGPLYGPHKTFRDELLTHDDTKRAASVLADAMDHAEAAGVTLCLEPLNRFEIQLVNTCDQAMELVRAVGHPRLAVHYDTHHAHIEERSHEDALLATKNHVGHFHFSESHRGTLGTGMIDWSAVGRGIRANGYDGWCVVEAFGTYVDGLRQAANVFRNAFDSREEVAESGLEFMRNCIEG